MCEKRVLQTFAKVEFHIQFQATKVWSGHVWLFSISQFKKIKCQIEMWMCEIITLTMFALPQMLSVKGFFNVWMSDMKGNS